MAQCQNTTKDGKVRCQGSVGHQGAHFFGGVTLADFDTANSARHEEALRPALVRALEDVKRGNDNIEKLLALVATLESDITIATDALATVKDDLQYAIRGGGSVDLARTHTDADVALQALFNSRAARTRSPG